MIKKTVEYIKIPKKVFFGILIVIGIGVSIKMFKPSVELVDVGVISQGTFQKVIIDEATTEFSKKETITAPADGITPGLNLEAGDPVKKGQVLLEFVWDQGVQIKAPYDGFVLKVFEKNKRHVPRGTPLIEIGSSDKVQVVAKLLSEEVVDVKLGQKVIIKKWGKAQDLEAKVVKIEKVANEEISALGVKEQRVKTYMDIMTPREIWNSLGDGFRVEVSIVTKEVKEAILLPVGALFSKDNTPVIYIVDKNKLKLTKVEVGDKNRTHVHLISKLPAGTKVVLYPGPGLSDGGKIKIRNNK